MPPRRATLVNSLRHAYPSPSITLYIDRTHAYKFMLFWDNREREIMDPIRDSSIRVLMLPWLAHGHISPFLELAKSLSNRNFQIYQCSTPINLISIKQNLTQNTSTSIKLVEISLPMLHDLPPHHHTTNDLPPHLMPTLKRAFDMSQPSFSNILDTIKPDLVIYDFVQP